MNAASRKTLKNVAAVVLLALGIAGLFLPFLQGFLLIALAFEVSEFEYKRVLLRRLLRRRWARRWIPKKVRRHLLAQGGSGRTSSGEKPVEPPDPPAMDRSDPTPLP